MYDVVVKGGTLVDPAQGINEKKDVAVRHGKVVAVESRISGSNAKRVIDASGMIVTPGLVDLHAHTAHTVVRIGIDAEQACLRKGVTTVADAGTTGEIAFPSFKRFIIDKSQTRMFAFINIESLGMVELTDGNETNWEDQKWAELLTSMNERFIDMFVNVENTVAMIRRHRSTIIGIKWAHHGVKGLKLARKAADEAGVKLMIENRFMLDAIKLLKRGDIITHTYGNWSLPEQGLRAMVDEKGRVREEYRKAVKRGVILDVGHGRGSFSWKVAAAALKDGFPPFSMSTDLWTRNINGPVFDMPTTMSKWLHLGMSLEDVVRASTSNPASAIGSKEKFGTLKPGYSADIVVFDLKEGRFPLSDSKDVKQMAKQALIPVKVVRAGKIVV